MLIRKFGLAFAALFTMFAARSATAATVMCHSCTDQQIEAMAWEHLGPLRTYGPHYFVDLDRGVIRKYIYRDNMTPEFDPEYDAFEAWVELAPVEPQLVNAVTGVTQELVALKREEANVLIIPPDQNLPSNGYDSVINAAREQALVNYIANENRYSTMFNNFFEQFDIPFFNEDYIWYPQPIKYPNGDTATYQYNRYTMKWERAPNTLKDAAGNSIPENAAAVDGDGYREYEFDNTGNPQVREAMTNLIDYARLTGHNIVDARGGVTRAGYYVLTCAASQCTIWYIQ